MIQRIEFRFSANDANGNTHVSGEVLERVVFESWDSTVAGLVLPDIVKRLIHKVDLEVAKANNAGPVGELP